MKEYLPGFRQEKKDPDADFRRTVKCGFIIFTILLLALPPLFDLLNVHPPVNYEELK